MEDKPDIVSLLPAEPTVDDMGGSEEALELMKKSREHVQTMQDYLNSDDWEVNNEADNVTMWKMNVDGFDISFIKRYVEINADFDKVFEYFNDGENFKRIGKGLIWIF
jgi:hypothetical protein